ncbi:MAG: branched-chain amino acid ABC transporter permease [Chloroflexota bacterium]|jgi:branched-chain amino acid transport system permease protein
MQATIPGLGNEDRGLVGWLKNNRGLIGLLIFLIIFPFIVALIEGQSIGDVLASEPGRSKFWQSQLINVFILAIYAISYDLIFGITGLLSFGHAMFFATGAYFTGIAFKNLGWGLPETILGIIVIGILQALLFGIVLPRVKGITFALVTLGVASMFFIVVQSTELVEWTGAEVGLQGVIVPDYINSTTERYRFYIIALLAAFFIYLIYRRFVDSPTGRVCVANRENENRALMLGYNTFYFKLIALTVSSITAAFAGFLHTIHAPIVSPEIAGLEWTVAALLMILIGGVGTLSGAYVGALVFGLLKFYLDDWFGGDVANFLLGVFYIVLVLFVPYGIVGTLQLRSLDIKRGRDHLIGLLTGRGQASAGDT